MLTRTTETSVKLVCINSTISRYIYFYPLSVAGNDIDLLLFNLATNFHIPHQLRVWMQYLCVSKHFYLTLKRISSLFGRNTSLDPILMPQPVPLLQLPIDTIAPEITLEED